VIRRLISLEGRAGSDFLRAGRRPFAGREARSESEIVRPRDKPGATAAQAGFARSIKGEKRALVSPKSDSPRVSSIPVGLSQEFRLGISGRIARQAAESQEFRSLLS
jgi:hypothetical protein